MQEKLEKKTCNVCFTEKDIGLFYRNNKRQNYVYDYCKACYDIKRKKQRLAYKPRAREIHLFKFYKLTLEDYNRMLLEQDNKCAICNSKMDCTHKGLKMSACIDHCHVTGKVRAILCSMCNRGLGLFRDNAEFTRKAAEYLDKHTKER